MAYCLWQRHLRFDPADPIWPDRDRFILSNGHASMLLYSLLHLTGVQSVNPQYEVTGKPGPLGQGVATSVGMAAAGRWLAARYSQPGFRLFNFDVYALMGDGCMMERISSEAASLAGHLRLENLCWIYDNNHITIEGPTSLAFSEDVATRYQSSGWNVTRVGDANDLDMLSRRNPRHGDLRGLCAHPADPGQIRLRARPCDRGGQGPAGPLAPGMRHGPALSARHQKEGRMP